MKHPTETQVWHLQVPKYLWILAYAWQTPLFVLQNPTWLYPSSRKLCQLLLSMSPLLGPKESTVPILPVLSTFFLPDHPPPFSSQIPGHFLRHSSHHLFFVRNSRQTVSNLRAALCFPSPLPTPTTCFRKQQCQRTRRFPCPPQASPAMPG